MSYSVTYIGIDGVVTHEFPNLAKVQEYVKGRWQGVDYMDDLETFHNDYGHFTLENCNLLDIGYQDASDPWAWFWKELKQ